MTESETSSRCSVCFCCLKDINFILARNENKEVVYMCEECYAFKELYKKKDKVKM